MATTPTRRHLSARFSRSHCESRKASYADKAAALDAAERLMDAGRVRPGCHITPYLCPVCHTWHVYNRTIVFVDDPYRSRHAHDVL